ncbi:MAG: hypothetical protein NTV86_21080 [Planctomycetota bacterium]|nr:hypothetical protein [Planctomycetota bacterium]
MAKNDMAKLMERHLEKAVLGVCVLLLAFAAVHWLLSSPRDFTPAAGGASMEPSQVDGFLAGRAATLAAKARSKEVPEAILTAKGKQVLPEWDKIIQNLRLFKVNSLTQPALGDPQVATVQPAGAPPPPGILLADFVKLIPAPAAPRITSGVILPQADKAADIPINGGVAAYPFKKLVDGWSTLESFVAMAPVRVDVEVEETTLDGKVTVKPLEPLLRAAAAVKGKDNAPAPQPLLTPIPDYTDKNQPAVFGAINEINSERRQRQIVTPDLPNIWEASLEAWVPGQAILKPVLPEKLWPTMPTKAVGPVVKPPTGVTPRVTPPVPKPPAPTTPTVKPPVRPGTTPPHVTPPAVVRPPVTPTGVDAGGVRAPAPVRTVVPDRAADADRDTGRASTETVVSVLSSRRGAEEIYLWWLHPNVKPGSTCRYRVKVTFINPLLARPELAKNPEEAKIKMVEGPWSQWSEPVTVTRPVRFFLTNKVAEGQVRVVVFAHAMGQWVRHEYPVSQGDPIGRMEAQVSVWNPIAEKKQDVPVDFTTGAVSLDSDETTVVLTAGRSTVAAEIIYLDEDGHVKAATSATADRTSQAYKDYDELDQQSRQEPKRSGTGAGKGR